MTVEVLDPEEKRDKRKKEVDWERIELDYRSGIKTLREIADDNGITHGAVNKKAKQLGWSRDLTAKIREKALLLVSKDVVSTEVSNTQKMDTEREIVEVNARMQADVILSQRKSIGRYSAIAEKLIAELEITTDNREMFEQLGELLHKPDAKGVDKLNDIYMKVVALPGRVDNLKKLSEVLKTLVGLERQAFGLEDRGQEAPQEPEGKDDAAKDMETARRLAFLLVKPIKEAT